MYLSSQHRYLSFSFSRNNCFIGKWKEHLKSNNALVRYKSKQIIRILKDRELIDEFDIDLSYSIIEKMIVLEGGQIIVSLLDGTDIEVVI